MKRDDVTDGQFEAVEKAVYNASGYSSSEWGSVDPVDIIAASVNVVGSKLRLPRVELKDLIPGRWYWVADRRIGIGAFIRFKAPPHTPHGREFDSSEGIYGPIPEFELEET